MANNAYVCKDVVNAYSSDSVVDNYLNMMKQCGEALSVFPELENNCHAQPTGLDSSISCGN